MSEELKTIKELADELGISKKYLQNKISYEKKKQNLSIGNWKKISGKNTIVLSDKEQTLIKSWLNSLEDKADSLEDKQEDKADSLEDKQEDKAD
ncbi:helix-turn-helix transcriptional regulator, partial [Lactococcus lactis]|uniref:helix-turn-helix domain-containing protein n=2 Tax=Lactococcus lactis TaxID=1358 RepID=UPI00288DA9E2